LGSRQLATSLKNESKKKFLTQESEHQTSEALKMTVKYAQEARRNWL